MLRAEAIAADLVDCAELVTNEIVPNEVNEADLVTGHVIGKAID